MRVVLLDDAIEDLAWWRRYYEKVFPSGRSNAYFHLEQAVLSILDYPEIGRPISEGDLRGYGIVKTPFTIVYRLKSNLIEILRIWDTRRKPISNFRD